MALAYESNTSLAFDTLEMKQYGDMYANIAEDLRNLATKLDNLLLQLKSEGWTTPAGSAFQKMAEANWKTNIDKYADLLDTLKRILDSSATKYDTLVSENIEQTRL